MSPRWRRRCCVALLVATEAGYGRVTAVGGPNLFFTPRTRAQLELLWGIGVWLESSQGYRDQGRCDFELQALSLDEGCGINCSLTPQPGADYDRAVQDLGRRLAEAFGERRAPE